MKFTAGCIGKALQVILCILLGFVLCLGSIVGAGYFVVTKKGMMGTLEEKAGSKVGLDFNEDTEAMSVLDWGKQLVTVVGDMSSNTIGNIESLAGVGIISKTVEEAIGVPAATIKTATISTLAETISNNLTMKNAQEKFGIAFPDMPVFKDDKFLNSPLASALKDFDAYTLNQVITIKDDGNAILKKLGGVQIKELGGATTDTIVKSTLLCEMMTINDSSTKVLKALKYSSIESQYATDTEGNFILDGEGNKTYKKTVIKEMVEGVEVEKEVELIGINDRLEKIYMKDIIEITETSNVVLRKMRVPTEQEITDGKAALFGTEDLKLNELGGEKLNNIINTSTLGEFIAVNDDSEPIMKALKDTPLNGINGKIATLKLNEIFSAEKLNEGALSLIPSETTLSDIPTAMTNAMKNSTIATLKGKGVIAEGTFDNVSAMRVEQRAYIYDSNISGLLGGMIDFIANPITDNPLPLPPTVNYSYVSPDTKTITATTYSSLAAFVEAYNQFDTVSFNADVTITIDPVADAMFYCEEYSSYCIPVFNIDTVTTLAFTDGTNPVTVKCAVFDKVDSTYTLNKNQYAYFYVKTGSTHLTAVAVGIESVIIE